MPIAPMADIFSGIACNGLIRGVGSVESYGGGLTDRIYEASVLPEKWPEVLRQLTDLAHGVGTVLLSVRGNDVRYLASTEVFQTVVEAYFHAFPGVNERMKRLLAIQRAGFVSDSDVFSPAELESEPIFKNFLTPRGYGNGVASVLTLPNNELILFHTEGIYARGPLDAGSIAALNSLRAHLARSSFISSRLSFERARTAVETLSGISLAACAVTRSGTVLVANEHFSAERGYWTTRGSNKIAAMDRRVDGMLQVSLSNIHYDAQVRSLPMISVDGKAPAVLHVVPLRRAAQDLFMHAAAILVLMKASTTPFAGTSLLQALFDLSPAEADVAARIAAGETPLEIARRSGRSISTIRNQLKSILAKAGCRRQADLARLLAQLVPATPEPRSGNPADQTKA